MAIPEEVTYDLRIDELLDVIAAKFPGVEAAIYDDLRRTYAQLRDDVEKLAAGLLKLGVQKGDRVGVWSVNRYEWQVAWFALPRVGAILVPMDHWYRPEEAEYIMGHSEMVAVICTSNYLPMIADVRDKLPNLAHVVVMDGAAGKPGSDAPGVVDYSDVCSMVADWKDNQDVAARRQQLDKEDVTFILYTSGTTGNPKGAMLTHHNIVRNAIETCKVLRCGPEDKYLIPVPFSHCFGCVLAITCATITGSSQIPLLDQTPSVALEKVTKEKATVAHGTPTHFIRYIREKEAHPDKYDTSSLRTGIIAGAPCPPPVLEGIINVLTMPDIVIGYGLTEASPIITLTSPDDDFDHRINSVGRPIPDIEVKIVDEDMREVPVGEDGELVVRGPNVMKGYFKDPERTAQAIEPDGWLHTGDLARVDEEGYFKITGRIKDMIIYGGFNVYPKVVEDFLLKNPNVIECAVVGVPDDEYGEVVAVVAKVEDGFTEQDLVDYCYGQISSPSVPRYVFFDLPIPLSGRGKVQKYKLRQTLAEMKKRGELGAPMVPTRVREKQKA
ncbi:MAG: AMP-binding protein [Promethearchaeota archaeon]